MIRHFCDKCDKETKYGNLNYLTLKKAFPSEKAETVERYKETYVQLCPKHFKMVEDFVARMK